VAGFHPHSVGHRFHDFLLEFSRRYWKSATSAMALREEQHNKKRSNKLAKQKLVCLRDVPMPDEDEDSVTEPSDGLS
jgi:hypothetical protein